MVAFFIAQNLPQMSPSKNLPLSPTLFQYILIHCADPRIQLKILMSFVKQAELL
jgi:hypothetical protein